MQNKENIIKLDKTDPVFKFISRSLPDNIEIIDCYMFSPKMIVKNKPTKYLCLELRDKKSLQTSLATYAYNKIKRQLEKQGKI